MKRRVLLWPVFAVFLCPLCAQRRPRSDQRLPSSELQKEEILKAEYQHSLRDAAELVKQAQELKAELEKNGYHILSLGAVKKTEEIERLARRIKSRLRRF